MIETDSTHIRIGVAALVFNAKGEIFLAKRGENARNDRGYWEFPGGRVEIGEKLIEAVKREFSEEYGFEIDVENLFGIYESIFDENQEHWVSIVYIAKHSSGEPQILEPDKCVEIGWFKLDTLPEPMTILTSKEINDYVTLKLSP